MCAPLLVGTAAISTVDSRRCRKRLPLRFCDWKLGPEARSLIYTLVDHHASSAIFETRSQNEGVTGSVYLGATMTLVWCITRLPDSHEAGCSGKPC